MKPLSTPISYRHDINGLRAWAVIAVLLFHFKVPGVSAGFIGVDVFFVISGFLMTAIIIKGLEANNFSIWKFYLARIRRIVPALMMLLVVLLVLGWFWLPTPDYQTLGSQSAYALSFLSNIHFWRAAGYFDAAAQEKWLLHTWSLGIEFQFYVLFPIYLLILWKIKPQLKTLVWGLVIACAVSLAVSVLVSHLKPAAAFYLLPTRGWELAAGGLAFIVGREITAIQRLAKPMFWLGFGLWVVAAFLIDDSFAWPAGWALFPVLGTVLIILAQQTHAKLMHNSLAQWLGDRSYSLYLWHWPLVVALYFADLQQDWLWVGGAFALSLFLGHVSFRFVETPTRIYLTNSHFSKQIVVLGVTGLVIGLAAVSVRLFTFEGRLPAVVEIAAAEANNKDPRIKECFEAANEEGSPGCIYGSTNAVGAILMGDSHAGSVITALGKAAFNNELSTLHWGMSSCPTLDNVKYSDRKNRPTNICNDLNLWANQQLELEKYKNLPLVLVSRTSSYLMGPNEPDRQEEAKYTSVYFSEPYLYREDLNYIEEFQTVLTSTACRLGKNRSVYLMRPVPEYGLSIPRTLTKNIMFGRGNDDIKITLEEYHQRNQLVWQAQDQAAEQCGVKILNPLPYLCDDEFCYGSRNGRPLYYDDDHLSEYGNKYLVPMFEQVFRDQQE